MKTIKNTIKYVGYTENGKKNKQIVKRKRDTKSDLSKGHVTIREGK